MFSDEGACVFSRPRCFSILTVVVFIREDGGVSLSEKYAIKGEASSNAKASPVVLSFRNEQSDNQIQAVYIFWGVRRFFVDV